MWPMLRDILLLVIFFLVVAYIKIYFQARSAFTQAETLLKQGQLHNAVRHYGYAVRSYTPGNRYVEVAIRRIWLLGSKARQRGKVELSLYAFRHLRSSIYAIRNLYQPHHSWLAKSNQMIAEILPVMVSSDSAARRRSQEELRAEILQLLQRETTPHSLLSLLAAFFLLCWLAGATLVMRWSFALQETLKSKRIVAAISVSFVFFMLWITTLWWA